MKKTFVFSCLALIVLLLALIILFFTSFDAFSKKRISDEVAIRACIEKNLKATQDEDFDAFWETCKPSAQIKKQSEDALKALFETYDFSVTLNSYKLISIDGGSAVVESVVTTQKIRGPEFKDSRIKQNNHLKKIDGKWYIVRTDIKSYAFINETADETFVKKQDEEAAAESKDVVVEPGEEAAIRACIEKNIQATQNEDLDAFWETSKPANAQIKEQTEAVMKILFETYDLSYTIDSYKLTSYHGDSASVEVVMTTKKISGPEFNDNQIKSQHDLKKIDGKWYLVNSQMLDIKSLD